ncbi:MAG TPA: hypothetical protein VFI27_22440 [candidate division Zixibacteria bacterium]|nr:hypothetical protein [candidate division Zixibacteria bacterium]
MTTRRVVTVGKEPQGRLVGKITVGCAVSVPATGDVSGLEMSVAVAEPLWVAVGAVAGALLVAVVVAAGALWVAVGAVDGVLLGGTGVFSGDRVSSGGEVGGSGVLPDEVGVRLGQVCWGPLNLCSP